MKKLLFAIAGAAAFSAFADPAQGGAGDISWVGFEAYTADAGVVGVGDNGGSSDSRWIGEGDASLVKTYEGSDVAAPSITRPKLFAEDANAKYLQLNTEGIELKRKVNAEGSLEVAADGTYIDTLVQFTPSESAPTSTDLDGAKLAIWLGVDSEHNTTNLMVAGGAYSVAALDDDDLTVTPKSYKLSGTYEPGTWYRLTVKAIKSLASDQFSPYSGFQIFVNGGTPLTIVGDQAYTADALTWLEDGVLDDSSLLTGGTFIPSADTTLSAPTLTSVGFKGTGALDDFVVTTEDPFAGPAVIDFTLTLSLGANVTGAVIKTNDVAVVFAEGSAQIPENTVVTIEQPTFATGYELDTFTWGGVSIDPATLPTNFTMEAATTVAFTAKQTPAPAGWVDNPATEITPGDTAATAYPTLAGSALATADAQKLTTWAKAKSIAFSDIKDDTEGTYVDAFLLNCAVEDVEDEKDEFVLEITFNSEGNPVVNLPDGKEYNGKLQLKGKANLDDASWTNLEEPSSSYKFYMYELSL